MLPQTNRLLKGVVVDMICIRADGGQELGLGHIMRCISIASAIKSAGEEVCFILADENPVEFLRTRSLRYYVLQSDYRQMEEEIDRLAPVLEKEKPNLILVDSYFVTEEYMIQLRRFAPLAYLDDMGVISFSADILINYNIFADYDMYREKAKQYLLGVAYAPLRTEFVQWIIRSEKMRREFCLPPAEVTGIIWPVNFWIVFWSQSICVTWIAMW